MSRRFLPLAVVASILALLAGLYTSRPVPPAPPPAVSPSTAENGAEPSGPIAQCPVPLRWSLVRVDSQFGLSRADAIAAVEGSIALWEDATDRTLFIRDDAAGFPIAFVYDGRQAAAQRRVRLRAELEAEANGIVENQATLRGRTQRHVAEQTDYQRRLAEFNELAAGHNAAVQRWNQAANIPESILDELHAAEDRLKAEEIRLADEGSALETAGEALSASVERFRSAVAEHDRKREALDRVFAEGPVLAGRYLQLLTPDGRALPAREIQIFQFDDPTHLRLVMAHELGHAMGLRHEDEASAIMSEEHELAGAPTRPAVQPADLELLRDVCPEL